MVFSFCSLGKSQHLAVNCVDLIQREAGSLPAMAQKSHDTSRSCSLVMGDNENSPPPPLPAPAPAPRVARGLDAIEGEIIETSAVEGKEVQLHNDESEESDWYSNPAGFPPKPSGVRDWVKPLLLSHYPPLTSQSSWPTRLLHAVLCPIHGQIARLFTYFLLFVLVLLVSPCLLGHIGSPPNGTVFLLLILVTAGALVGQAFTWVHLPPLLGMLISGICLKNVPFIDLKFEDPWAAWSSTLRGVALVIILMRAGLGLDPAALKRLSGKVTF